MRFEVPMAVSITLSSGMLCSLVGRLKCFGRECCSRHLGRMFTALALIVAGMG